MGVYLFPLVAIVVVAVLVYGRWRWQSETHVLRARLDAARQLVQPRTIDFTELERLPAPVERFFRAALTEGHPMVAGVRMQHEGTFNMGETSDQWKPFTSGQRVVTRRPGFDWDGRIAIMPGLAVRVHDAYIAGEGILHASLLGLVSLATLRGTRAMAEGELMRFLAEAAWYPTALLPDQGVTWQPVDDHAAIATLTDGDVSVTLLFTFSESGLIDTAYAESRARMVAGNTVPTPWQGRFWGYEKRESMSVPLEGEVAWLLPAGEKPYWRGRITDLAYEFAELKGER